MVNTSEKINDSCFQLQDSVQAALRNSAPGFLSAVAFFLFGKTSEVFLPILVEDGDESDEVEEADKAEAEIAASSEVKKRKLEDGAAEGLEKKKKKKKKKGELS